MFHNKIAIDNLKHAKKNVNVEIESNDSCKGFSTYNNGSESKFS